MLNQRGISRDVIPSQLRAELYLVQLGLQARDVALFPLRNVKVSSFARNQENTPFLNIRCFPYTHRTPRVDYCANDIIISRTNEHFLVFLGSPSFFTGHETSSYPNTRCTIAIRKEDQFAEEK